MKKKKNRKKDKKLIDDKHLEREEKFKVAIETYRRSVNRELETFNYHEYIALNNSFD